ncbi:MAG: carboxylesterase [Legionella sp.]|nr:MAG: carboxylesterase [Legionella sp.]
MLTTYTKSPEKPAQACIIWLHGLGSNGTNMHGVVDAFPAQSTPIEHVFIDAPVRPVTMNNHMPMRAWYDLTGLTLQDRDDREGILQSERDINTVIEAQIAKGFQPQSIYLAGFSQGGAMALFMGLRSQQRLGGIVALSAYLPQQNECGSNVHLDLPIFMAMGSIDPIVLPAWTKLSHDFVLSRGFTDVFWKEYRMEHTICIEEIMDVVSWIEQQIKTVAIHGEKI